MESTKNKVEWMSSSPETPVGSKRHRTQSTTQRIAEGSADNFQHNHQHQRQARLGVENNS